MTLDLVQGHERDRLLGQERDAGGKPLRTFPHPIGRIAKTTSGGASTDFLYDGTRLIAEYDSTTAAMLRSYVHGNGTDEPLLWLEGATYNDPHFGDSALICRERPNR